MFGGWVVAISPQVPLLFDRPACADTVMQAVSSQHPIDGTYDCFEKNLQTQLEAQGVDSDAAFAAKVGKSGRYHLVGKTGDGGYAFEYDRAVFPHDGKAAVRKSVGVAWERVRGGDVGALLIPVQVTWGELTRANEGTERAVIVLYVDDQGKVWRVK